METKKCFLAIDANSVIHRAFHALPLLTTKKGEVVNAVYGFLLVFFRALKEFQPDYVATCFDFPAPTFRHKKFKDYKAKRPPAPKELYPQFPKVKGILNAFNVQIFEKEGFEADDLIGTIARRVEEEGDASKIGNIILSGDLDCLQLINAQTRVYVLRKGVKNTVLYDQDLVKKQYQGLDSPRLLDFKALKGDPSDNIPGVRGIGEKTAIKLIKEFGTLNNLYSALKGVNPRLQSMLEEQKEQAFLSYNLAEIKKDVPIDFALEKCRWGDYDEEEAARRLTELDFYSLVKKLPEIRKGAMGTASRQGRDSRAMKDSPSSSPSSLADARGSAVNGRLKLW